MEFLIASAFIVALLYLLACSCLFNNHPYEIVESDEEHDCHKVRCVSCGREDRIDPWAGRAG